MVSTYTPNINLEEPARGDQVGTWDTPVNNNMTLTDLVVGGIATIVLNNSPVVLATAQFQARQITFSSTLTGSCAITFPSTFTKAYDIQNLCSGSSAFVITLRTTAAAGQAICVPFGETVECFNDGTNIKFKNLGRIGSYWDYCGSSVPAWVSGCTVPPYLNCTGATFASSIYPFLAVILGSTTLPDARGRVRATIDQGTTRLTSAISGIAGTSVGSAGGNESVQAHVHATAMEGKNVTVLPQVFSDAGFGTQGPAGGVASTPINTSNYGAGGSENVQPTYMGGLTLIRSA